MSNEEGTVSCINVLALIVIAITTVGIIYNVCDLKLLLEAVFLRSPANPLTRPLTNQLARIL